MNKCNSLGESRNRGRGFTPLEMKKKRYDLSQHFRSKKRKRSNIKSNLRSDVSSELSLTGFTLMELLVVIAIISMLAAMIFPNLGKVRIRARKAKAIAELKVIELALMDYYTEYSGFPTNLGKSPPTTNGINKLSEEGYLDTPLLDAFNRDRIYSYYSCMDDDYFADSCIVFSVGPDQNNNGIANFINAHTDAYLPDSDLSKSDNIYMLVPLDDIRYKK